MAKTFFKKNFNNIYYFRPTAAKKRQNDKTKVLLRKVFFPKANARHLEKKLNQKMSKIHLAVNVAGVGEQLTAITMRRPVSCGVRNDYKGRGRDRVS